MSKPAAALVVAMLVTGGLSAVGEAQSGAQPPSGTSSIERGARNPAFVQVNRTYSIRWQPGDNEVYTILEVKDGWARGKPLNNANAPAEVWLNLQQAITITEQRQVKPAQRPNDKQE